MRAFPLALLGLLLAAGPALAASGKDGAGITRGKVAAASAPARAGAVPKPDQARRGVKEPRSATQTQRAAACARGRGACGGRSFDWTAGLPPAMGVQMAGCPAGTMATLATGHSDVVRCMPF
jgi:hypothetical protein